MSQKDGLYLRMSGGKIFGPIDLDTLRQWARDGRVEPSAVVSQNREEWMRAADIPELEMEWVVENAPGQFYGPTNRAVVDDFIKSGALAPTARFYRDMRSGLVERVDAEEAVADARNRLDELQNSLAAVNSELAETRFQMEESRASFSQSEARLKEVGDSLAGSQRELSAARARCAELEAENARLKDDCANQLAVGSRLLADKQALEDDNRRLEADRQKLEDGIRELRDDRDSMENSRNRLEEENRRRQKELEEARKELEELRLKIEAEKAAENVLVPEVVVEGVPPPRAQDAFANAPVSPIPASSERGASFFGGVNPTSLADLERAAQAELARMRASGARGFFFGRKKK